jgi:hypothetical protein
MIAESELPPSEERATEERGGGIAVAVVVVDGRCPATATTTSTTTTFRGYRGFGDFSDSLPRSSICCAEEPTSTSKSPGSAFHCLAV